MSWTNKLLIWYSINRRSFPWRKTPYAYNVWLSEIILQQTKSSQGIPYYIKFIEKYPSIHDLAKANEKDVLKLWQGLGYYSRAINLLSTAKNISKNFNGIFPKEIDSLKKLKGIGDYTASAIASICFGTASAVVDGNVYRVISRFFGIETPINSSTAYSEFKSKARLLMGNSSPSDFNQAIMEFGAIQCTPKKPNCNKCIFNIDCFAFNNGKTKMLPAKFSKNPIKSRYFNFLIFKNKKGETILEQRKKKDIWHKLYQFPLIESNGAFNIDQFKFEECIIKLGERNLKTIKLLNKKKIKHRLSHQILYISFWEVKVKSLPEDRIVVKNLKNYPVPVVLEKFFDSNVTFES